MDRQITRWAALGYTRVLMFGRWWELERGKQYHVKFNCRKPSKSKVVEA